MNKLIRKSVKWMSVIAVAGVLFCACNKDEDSASMVPDSEALFIEAPGQTGTMGFAAENIRSIIVSAKPAGWEVTADLATQIITATAPVQFGGVDKAVRSGTVSILGHSYEGNAVTMTLFVTVSSTVVDLTANRANTVIISEPYTEYTFDVSYKGETSERLAASNVRVIWQTASGLIKYPAYKGGVFSFYIDGEENKLIEGNALLGAFDEAGNLLWSWLLWVVDAADVGEQSYANGKTFMSLNLGALNNTNLTNDEILDSYGLFYQWGRKEPFVGPHAYNAAKAQDHSIYNAGGTKIELLYVPSTSETGTETYAAANPLSFILGVEESAYDWRYASHSDALWSATKTVNDPCPKGWRVPSKEDFEGLQIVDMASGKEGQFGWALTDGTATSLYPAAGFRPYLTGRIQNVYNPIWGVDVPKPWVGYYWTNGTEVSRSSALYFWLDAADVTKSGIEYSVSQYRANGMQIRCVKQ